jgi:hypothetical protein
MDIIPFHITFIIIRYCTDRLEIRPAMKAYPHLPDLPSPGKMTSLSPGLIFAAELRWFQIRSAGRGTSNFAAIEERVSPFFTT